eukprot:1382456-Pleurochrysis_carterae.AAC.1
MNSCHKTLRRRRRMGEEWAAMSEEVREGRKLILEIDCWNHLRNAGWAALRRRWRRACARS